MERPTPMVGTEESSRVSDEWRQNRRESTNTDVQRRELLKGIEKALGEQDARRRSIADTLANRKLSDEDRAAQQTELGRVDALIDNLKARRRELAVPDDVSGQQLGRDEAHDIEEMLDAARGDLRRDFSDILRKFGELDAERTRLYGMKKNLAAREEWLKNNPPPKTEK